MSDIAKHRYLSGKREILNRLSQRPCGYLANECAAHGGAAIYAFARAKRGGLQLGRPTVVGHGDVIRIRDLAGNRRSFVVAIVNDEDHGSPWDEECGHGPVSEWTRRDKRPGELVLVEHHDSRRYYDFQEACRIARRDGWNAEPYDVPGETSRQRAAKAAMADYERLRQWCNGVWCYVGVCLFELPHDGMERSAYRIADDAPFGILPHWGLWGIESDVPDYHATVAWELAGEAAREVRKRAA